MEKQQYVTLGTLSLGIGNINSAATVGVNRQQIKVLNHGTDTANMSSGIGLI
jgi:hypothetical protein